MSLDGLSYFDEAALTPDVEAQYQGYVVPVAVILHSLFGEAFWSFASDGLHAWRHWRLPLACNLRRYDGFLGLVHNGRILSWHARIQDVALDNVFDTTGATLHVAVVSMDLDAWYARFLLREVFESMPNP